MYGPCDFWHQDTKSTKRTIGWARLRLRFLTTESTEDAEDDDGGKDKDEDKDKDKGGVGGKREGAALGHAYDTGFPT